jgi:serine/threonine-protein kinase ATR
VNEQICLAMAPTSHGRSGPQGRDGVTNTSFYAGPPPSTLAAQLVENLSTAARSSRPDETEELTRLFSVIEGVKDQPGLVKTQQERVQHNHMLIYVSARISLDGLKWDDPFANKTELRAGALRAVNILKVALRETPEVLLFIPAPESFLLRGREPLWIWVLPKLLRMLNYGQGDELTRAVESLFLEIFSISCQTAVLWSLTSQILAYLRANLRGRCCGLLFWFPFKLANLVQPYVTVS